MLQEKGNVKVLGPNPYTLNHGNKSLIKTDLQVNIQLSLLMTLAAKARLTEGQLRRLKSA
jgi:hypothetical protein